MSSLFSNLPTESADKHIREAEEELIPPNKRLKTEVAASLNAQVKPPQLTGKDPVATALIKITSHISSSKKFTKASELLRQLILEHKIGQEHSKLVFEVGAAALTAICSHSYQLLRLSIMSFASACTNRHSKLPCESPAALRTLRCGASTSNSSHWLARQLT